MKKNQGNFSIYEFHRTDGMKEKDQCNSKYELDKDKSCNTGKTPDQNPKEKNADRLLNLRKGLGNTSHLTAKAKKPFKTSYKCVM